MKRTTYPSYISQTGAQFETTEMFLKNSTVVNSLDEELQSAGIPLTHVKDDVIATSPEEMHCFVIGETGCGKTRRVVLPTIRLLAKTGESMLISDPKGELYRKTAGVLRKNGYDVRVLNFRSPMRGNRWNPLALIDELYHSGDLELQDRATMMLNDILDVLRAGIHSSKDMYWENAAGNVFLAAAYTILEYGQQGDLTFENIVKTGRRLNTMIAEKGRSGPFGQSGSHKNLYRVFEDVVPADSVIFDNLSGLLTNAQDTRNCIMSVFENMLSIFSSQDTLKDLFSCSEIDVSQLGKKSVALFFILPDDTQALYPIATVFVKQIYSTLVSLADEQPGGRLQNRVTFLLDEFANFAKIPSVESMLTAARSRGIRFVLVCQSMDQLIEKYEEAGKETLISNCRVWLYMNCRNLNFLEKLEKMLGFYRSPWSEESRPLIDVSELQHFDREKGQVLILNDRCRPMMGYLQDYSLYRFGGESEADIQPEELPEKHDRAARILFDFEKVMRILDLEDLERRLKEEQEKDRAQQSGRGEMGETTLDEAMAMLDLRAALFRKQMEESEDDDDLLLFDDLELSEIGDPLADELDFEFTDETEEGDPVTDLPEEPSRKDEEEEKSGQSEETVAETADTEENAAPEAAAEKRENNGMRYLTAIDYLRQGEYLQGAQAYIDKTDYSEIIRMNNIAFFIRFGKLDTSMLKADFSLEIPDLLKNGVASGDGYSTLNMALYEIEKGDYKKAVILLKKIEVQTWKEISSFWFQEIWKRKEEHPEGALVCALAFRMSGEYLYQETTGTLLRAAIHRYRDFLMSDPFMKLLKLTVETGNREADRMRSTFDSKLVKLMVRDSSSVAGEKEPEPERKAAVRSQKKQTKKEAEEEKETEETDDGEEDGGSASGKKPLRPDSGKKKKEDTVSKADNKAMAQGIRQKVQKQRNKKKKGPDEE